MKVLLDTNFLLSCVREKVFFDSLVDELFPDVQVSWLVPQEVLNELGNLKDAKGSNAKDVQAATVAFEVLQHLGPEVVELGGNNPHIDMRIVKYLLDHPKVILATLDKDLKARVPNKILTLRGKKKLELI